MSEFMASYYMWVLKRGKSTPVNTRLVSPKGIYIGTKGLLFINTAYCF